MARKLPLLIQGEQARALLDATASDRDLLLVYLGLSAGLRVSELVRLRVEDLDFGRAMLTVRQGKGRKDRGVPTTAHVAASLKEWLGGRQEGFLFPSPRRPDRPLTTRAVQKLIKRLAVKAGFPHAAEARQFTPHKLRHYFATKLLEGGATIFEVQELLGHASIQTTQVYLHANPQRLRGAVERLEQGF